MTGKLLRYKNCFRSEIGVHEPIEKLIHADEVGLDPVVQRPIINCSNWYTWEQLGG